MKAQRAALYIADRFFAPEEVTALRELPASAQPRRFFEYWTLKESYIKARGMGLSIPLDAFAFDLDDPASIQLAVDASLGDCPERWMFWRVQVARSHVAAVCAARDAEERLHLTSIRFLGA